MNLEDLTEDRKQVLLLRLTKEGVSEELAKEFDIVIPNRLHINYYCPACKEISFIRIFTSDILGINKYINCPKCREKSFLQSLGKIEQKAKVRVKGMDKWF